MRTTVDIADPVLDEVRRIQEREDKTLGAVVSEVLAEGLAVRAKRGAPSAAPPFQWISKPMGAKIDLEDKEALWAILDAEDGFPHR